MVVAELTRVYARQNYTKHGVYKPTYHLVGPDPVCLDGFIVGLPSSRVTQYGVASPKETEAFPKESSVEFGVFPLPSPMIYLLQSSSATPRPLEGGL